eukprot:203821-Chlamydomonas_euryale.AAC.1
MPCCTRPSPARPSAPSSSCPGSHAAADAAAAAPVLLDRPCPTNTCTLWTKPSGGGGAPGTAEDAARSTCSRAGCVGVWMCGRVDVCGVRPCSAQRERLELCKPSVVFDRQQGSAVDPGLGPDNGAQ